MYAELKKLTDAQLIERLISNDESAIAYVFYHQYEPLLKYNVKKTGCCKDIDYEDVIHDLFLYLSKNDWEKLRKYDPKLPFVNWFSVVSYRFFKDLAASMIDSSQKIPISEMDDHSFYLMGNNRTEATIMDVKAAIAQLEPPRDREVVEALVLNDEEPADVAQRLHVTVDNLYNIKRRALAKLIQKHLQDYVKK